MNRLGLTEHLAALQRAVQDGSLNLSPVPAGFNEGVVQSQCAGSGQLLYQENHKQARRSDYVYLGSSLVAFRERPLSGTAETLKYQHTEALGSPLVVTSATKALIESSEYEPYGRVVNKPLFDGPGYTGHVQDAATGLTCMQQRYYDPMLGVFLSVDPVTAYPNQVSQFHRYRYANSNPYKFTDPDGRRSMADRPGIQQSAVVSTGPLTSTKSWGQRAAAADRHIQRVESNLQSREGGNRFDSVDDSARYFRRNFANMGQYLRLEFGGYANPGSNSIANLSRSSDPDGQGVGVDIHVAQGPIGGATFHTHPEIAHPKPGFSFNDITVARSGNSDFEYVFYGDSVGIGRKWNLTATSGVSDEAIYHYQDIYAPVFE